MVSRRNLDSAGSSIVKMQADKLYGQVGHGTNTSRNVLVVSSLHTRLCGLDSTMEVARYNTAVFMDKILSP